MPGWRVRCRQTASRPWTTIPPRMKLTLVGSHRNSSGLCHRDTRETHRDPSGSHWCSDTAIRRRELIGTHRFLIAFSSATLPKHPPPQTISVTLRLCPLVGPRSTSARPSCDSLPFGLTKGHGASAYMEAPSPVRHIPHTDRVLDLRSAEQARKRIANPTLENQEGTMARGLRFNLFGTKRAPCEGGGRATSCRRRKTVAGQLPSPPAETHVRTISSPTKTCAPSMPPRPLAS